MTLKFIERRREQKRMRQKLSEECFELFGATVQRVCERPDVDCSNQDYLEPKMQEGGWFRGHLKNVILTVGDKQVPLNVDVSSGRFGLYFNPGVCIVAHCPRGEDAEKLGLSAPTMWWVEERVKKTFPFDADAWHQIGKERLDFLRHINGGPTYYSDYDRAVKSDIKYCQTSPFGHGWRIFVPDEIDRYIKMARTYTSTIHSPESRKIQEDRFRFEEASESRLSCLLIDSSKEGKGNE